MLAIAEEAGVDFDISKINEISNSVAHIAKYLQSLTTVHMEDINRAGGVSVFMKRDDKRRNSILEDNLAVTERGLFERLKMLRF